MTMLIKPATLSDMSNISNLSAFEKLGNASGFVDDIHELFRTLSLLQDYSHEECNVLCQYMECYGAPSSTVILEEDADGDYLLIVLTGSVNVTKRWQNKDNRIVATVGPGEFLGEMSLIDSKKRSASCITAEPTDFAIFKQTDLQDILIDHPRLGNKILFTLLRLITDRLRETTVRMLPAINCSLV